MLSKFIGNRSFYKTVFSITLPILFQNLVTNFVNMVDNIMVGSIGIEQMSGVSIVNQLIFIFNITIFGAVSGAGIFTAQYCGKKDLDGIRYTIRFKLLACTLVSIVAIILFITIGDPLISLYLHDGTYKGDLSSTLGYGLDYLIVMVIGLFPFALTNTYASTLRESGETLIPTIFSFIAVGINCLFNYLLIFGIWIFPCLGVTGAAIATVFSRIFEAGGLILYCTLKKERFPFFRKLFVHFSIPKQIFIRILTNGMPLLINECLWSVGMTVLNISYSMHGLAVVAGISISSTVINLFNMVYMAFGNSIGIIVGQQLGAGRFDEAVDTDRKMITLAIFISVLVGIVVYATGWLFPLLYNTTEESKELATFFIQTCACFMPIVSFMHATYFTLRSGGKVWITFLFDSVYVICVAVPVAFALFGVFHLSIWIIYPIVQSMDLIKCIIGSVLLKKHAWVNNIVSDPQ